MTTTCRTCVTPISYIDCPTGGWWAHEQHPADGHDAIPAAWADGDPLMEAIASTVWEHCAGEGTSLIVDDPRNIAGTAAAVARRMLAQPAAVSVPPPTREAAWREAADTVEAMNEGCGRAKPCASCDARTDAADDLRDIARRMAAEAQQQPDTETPTEEQIVRDHVTSLHLIGEQLADIENWMWRHLADVRDASGPGRVADEETDAETSEADRLRCPRCRKDITDYGEDTRVYLAGDDRPYCSGGCVLAVYRGSAAEQPDTQKTEHTPDPQ